MNKILLVDHITHLALSPQQLNEAIENKAGGLLLIKNVLLQEKDFKNQNGRIYPGEILAREAKKYDENFIQTKSSFGELDHPETAIVRLEKTSHLIPRIYWDGVRLKGDINILDTPCGRIVESILKAGGRVGISSRSLGSVEKVKDEITGEDFDKVGDDLELICFDLVSNPSVLNASFKLTEGLEINKRILNKYDNINFFINKILE